MYSMQSVHGGQPIALVPLLAEAAAPPRRPAVRSYGKDNLIYAEGDPSDVYYRVLSGAVRSCKYLSDGRRQIAAFHVTGELFGVEWSTCRTFSAEATRGARIAVIARFGAAMAAWSGDAELMQTTFLDLKRAQTLAVILGRKSAAERLATFLLDLAQRLGRRVVELPMSRSDIADHLGLTIETVSRTFSLLEREKVIRLPAPKTVVLQDEIVLNRLNEGQPVGGAFE